MFSPSHRLRSREQLHAYWREPDAVNTAKDYVGQDERSEYLVGLLADQVEGPVLEIGCNAGRNLHHLLAAGHRVGGIEISERALGVMREAYPDVVERATIYAGPVEELIRELGDGEYDTIFTMAVLEHLHTDSEWVFGEIARVASRRIVTIEDERSQTWRHVPRNYRHVFEAHGAWQIAEPSCVEVPGIDNLTCRVFAVG